MITKLICVLALLCFVIDGFAQQHSPQVDLVFVEGGTFSPNPSHIVTISSFFIGKYEINQSQFMEVMKINPSIYNSDQANPVENINWMDMVEFCNRLSILHKLQPCYSYVPPQGDYGTDPDKWPKNWKSPEMNNNYQGYQAVYIRCNWNATGYRLPTEMEWRYAAMGGNKSKGYIFSGSNIVDDVAWYSGNTLRENGGKKGLAGYGHKAVGTKKPNELGIHDMTGNVNEWVWDVIDYNPKYDPNKLKKGTIIEETNPRGGRNQGGALTRVVLGGCWCSNIEEVKLPARYSNPPTSRSDYSGFRIAQTSINAQVNSPGTNLKSLSLKHLVYYSNKTDINMYTTSPGHYKFSFSGTIMEDGRKFNLRSVNININVSHEGNNVYSAHENVLSDMLDESMESQINFERVKGVYLNISVSDSQNAIIDTKSYYIPVSANDGDIIQPL
jgi:sulfatase modifying factor 1